MLCMCRYDFKFDVQKQYDKLLEKFLTKLNDIN